MGWRASWSKCGLACLPRSKRPPRSCRAIARIVNQPEIRDKLVAGGYGIVLSSPEQLAERVKLDYEKYRKIILDHHMQME